MAIVFIPIDYATDIVDQIKESGEVARGWLGVTIQEVTTEFVEQPRYDFSVVYVKC